MTADVYLCNMTQDRHIRLQILQADASTHLRLPFADAGIPAGAPEPPQDYINESIDLNRDLIQNPTSTFYARVVGDSMSGEGIDAGDLLVVDRSLEPMEGDLAVCCLNGEFTLKRLHMQTDGRVFLMPSNRRYRPIEVKDCEELVIWGVVSYTIKANRRPRVR